MIFIVTGIRLKAIKQERNKYLILFNPPFMSSLIKISIFCLLAISVTSCTQDNDTWAKYTSKEGAFSVFMPTHLLKLDKKEVTPFGKQVTHYVTWKPSTFAIDKFKLFQVSYTDCPARVCTDSVLLNAALDSAINLRKKDFTESEIESQVIELNGYPGRSFIYDNSNATAIVKLCIVNNRKYDLTVVTKKNYATNTDVSNFFDSFMSLK